MAINSTGHWALLLMQQCELYKFIKKNFSLKGVQKYRELLLSH